MYVFPEPADERTTVKFFIEEDSVSVVIMLSDIYHVNIVKAIVILYATLCLTIASTKSKIV